MSKSRNTTAGLIRAVCLGAGVALAVAMISCALCAVLIRNGLIPEERMTICAMAICALGVIPGCLLSQALAGRARLPVSLGCAGVTLAVLVGIRGFLRTGSPWSWYAALVAGVCAVGCAFLGAGKGR